MKNQVLLVTPQPILYDSKVDNLSIAFQIEHRPDIAMKYVGISYSRIRFQGDVRMMGHQFFDRDHGGVLGKFNRLLIMVVEMYDVSTRAQTWIRVSDNQLQNHGYDSTTFLAVMKSLIIHNLLDYGKDPHGVHHYKFRYETLIQCKLNKQGFILSLRCESKEKSIAQNWKREDISSHVKAILFEKVAKDVLIKRLDFSS